MASRGCCTRPRHPYNGGCCPLGAIRLIEMVAKVGLEPTTSAFMRAVWKTQSLVDLITYRWASVAKCPTEYDRAQLSHATVTRHFEQALGDVAIRLAQYPCSWPDSLTLEYIPINRQPFYVKQYCECCPYTLTRTATTNRLTRRPSAFRSWGGHTVLRSKFTRPPLQAAYATISARS